MNTDEICPVKLRVGKESIRFDFGTLDWLYILFACCFLGGLVVGVVVGTQRVIYGAVIIIIGLLVGKLVADAICGGE